MATTWQLPDIGSYQGGVDNYQGIFTPGRLQADFGESGEYRGTIGGQETFESQQVTLPNGMRVQIAPMSVGTGSADQAQQAGAAFIWQDPKDRLRRVVGTIDAQGNITESVERYGEMDDNVIGGLLKDVGKFGLKAAAAYYGVQGLATAAGSLSGAGAPSTGLGISDAEIANVAGPSFERGITIGQAGGLNLAETAGATLTDAGSVGAAGTTAAAAAAAAPSWSAAAEAGGMSILEGSGSEVASTFGQKAAEVVAAVKGVLPSKETLKDIGTSVGILGSVAALIGGGKILLDGGTTTTASQGVTPGPRDALETEMLNLAIANLKADAANYAALQPIIKQQLDAAQKELQRQAAQDPGAIKDFVERNISKEGGMQLIADAARKYGVSVTQIADATGYTPEQITEHTGLRLSASEKLAASQQEITNIQLENLKRGTAATKEQKGYIDTQFDEAYKSGEADINRWATETARAINEEVAAASGLQPGELEFDKQGNVVGVKGGDTPIRALYDRGLAEVLRQKGILESNKASGKAAAYLNYPLAAQTVANATTQSAGSLNLASQQFQASLEQQAANNRYRLFQNPMQIPQSNNAAASLALNLGNQRIGLGTTNVTSTRGTGLEDYAKLISGIGGVMAGFNRLYPS